MTKILEALTRLGACDKPLAWIAHPENEGKSPDELWETCPRGDWLMWLVTEAGVPRNLVAPAVCDCARLALPYVPDGENRPRLCIEAAEDYLRGKATVEQVRAAYLDAVDAGTNYCSAAYSVARALRTNADAANAAAGYAAYSAAYAADYAAKSADCTSYAFIGSTDSVDYAALAADCVAYIAAGYKDYAGADCAGYASVNASVDAGGVGGGSAGWRSETQAKCAYLIQSRISWSVVDAALKLKGIEI